MRQTDKFQWARMDSLGASMVELPYRGGRLVMQILLPSANNGLGQLEERLRNVDLDTLFDASRRKKEVVLQLPKFKLEQTIDLKPHLQDLGMRDMFTVDEADFSKVDGSKLLYVSTVLQKTFIEVNEEGSKATAATFAQMRTKSRMPPPQEFTADHPFLFFLMDKLSGMLLFQGRVEDITV